MEFLYCDRKLTSQNGFHLWGPFPIHRPALRPERNWKFVVKGDIGRGGEKGEDTKKAGLPIIEVQQD